MVDNASTSSPKEPFYKNIYFILFLAGAAFLTTIRPYLRREPPPPAVETTLPTFSFVNQQNESFGSEQLKGRVYVANFIFTRCPSVCPMLSQKMAELRRRFDENKLPILTVSFTVDPDFDTPSELLRYSEKYNANSKTWLFLTAPREQVVKLVEQGFGLAIGEPTESAPMADIAHAQKFTIVDGNGGLRGYYEATGKGLEEVFYRAQHVLKEKN